VKRELKPITLLAAVNISGVIDTGTALMIQSTLSEQGGVVREPTYLQGVS
jgi:hypothetical protein